MKDALVFQRIFNEDEDTVISVGARRTEGWEGAITISVHNGSIDVTLRLGPERARELGVCLMDAATAAEGKA